MNHPRSAPPCLHAHHATLASGCRPPATTCALGRRFRFKPVRRHHCRPEQRRRQQARCCRQRGQGALEFLLAATPVVLLGLGSIEAIHWYFTRQAVSLALAQAARAAITQHADPTVLDHAFRQALLPLYAGPSPAISQARLQRIIQRREHQTGLPAWRLRIVSPSAASFSDFASHDPELPQHGHPVIDNDYLHEQHQARLAQGWPAGRGPLSGQNTFEANTLTLHLTWLHEPLLPGVRQLLKQLASTDTRYGSRAMAAAGYLPMHRHLSFVMQSHPVEWHMPAHGRVLRQAGPAHDQDEWHAGIRSGSAHDDTRSAAPPEGLPPAYGGPAPAEPAHPSGAGNANSQPSGDASGDTPASHGGIVRGSEPARPPDACTGLWCLDSLPAGSTDVLPVTDPGADAGTDPHVNDPAAGPEAASDSAAGLATDTLPGLEAGPASEPPDVSGDAYLGTDPAVDAELPTLPADPDDCPGCCA